MTVEHLCANCGSPRHYQTFCPYKKRKPISKRGKQTILYETFRDTVAKPYLDKKYGHVCSVKTCDVTDSLDVDHIKTRGGHSALKMDVKNLRYLCRPHHRQVTDGEVLKFKKR